MAYLIRVTEALSLGLHAMVLLASEKNLVLSTADMAEKLQVSSAHLSKVLQRLTKAGLVKSIRGPAGGYTLAGKGDKTTMLEVYECLEGPFRDSECLFPDKICSSRVCIMGGMLEEINSRARDYLATTRLKDLSDVYK
ncbi:MAG: Rrf2 family transcriptional regulator [Actinobacteria bacterium]|nr:Rrf2 family transcriptional regulator [Actinomycetota bacterium]